MSSLCSSAHNNFSAVCSPHSLSETMNSGSGFLLRLECHLHYNTPPWFILHKITCISYYIIYFMNSQALFFIFYGYLHEKEQLVICGYSFFHLSTPNIIFQFYQQWHIYIGRNSFYSISVLSLCAKISTWYTYRKINKQIQCLWYSTIVDRKSVHPILINILCTNCG